MNDLKRESIIEEKPINETESAESIAEITSETTTTNQENKPGAENVPETIAENSVPSVQPRREIKQVLPQTDEMTRKVEKIMEEDLKEAFRQLSPIAQQEFKIKGEQTAKKIREIMRSTTIKVKKIFHLILSWLKILPGINKFFLEQEAKIKTDRIILLHQEHATI